MTAGGWGGKYIPSLKLTAKATEQKPFCPPWKPVFSGAMLLCCSGVYDVEFRCIDGSYILYQIVAVNGVPKFHEVVARIPKVLPVGELLEIW